MRMYRANAKAANLKDHLLFVRCGGGMHTRRHGLKNALALRRFYREMYMMGEIGYVHYLFDIACACGLQLMPAWLHKACYKLIRKNTTPYQAGPKARERKPALPRGERLTRESSPEDIRLAQQEIFGIYQDVKRVCDEEGLRLILSGGSCLGAVRHGGFIPWDDDMDTVMPREDYERLKELFDSRLGDRYIMQVPGKKGSVPSNLLFECAHAVYLVQRFIQCVLVHAGLIGRVMDEIPCVLIAHAPVAPGAAVQDGVAVPLRIVKGPAHRFTVPVRDLRQKQAPAEQIRGGIHFRVDTEPFTVQHGENQLIAFPGRSKAVLQNADGFDPVFQGHPSEK